ncbi:beta-lactamase-like protein [Cokeromyces recurvatus]|uniref:beta-lactamase-like protein n=1 Tax=Cokeromyces recurvatus TaxID=90255 RepID=UPI00221EA802|nr:beta-lactamase-like protein [Cokeromyces recurvatus]KAI7898297.1 beta-lactamase-like protein [Cokeromyces recurvatus]
MTEVLVSLPKFSQLSSRVWRILGLNPGKFTLQGTNTYLLGTGAQKILLDCGEGKPEYLSHLETSLQQINPDAYISDIIISHGHRDHWGGLNDILTSKTLTRKSPIRIHKYPIPEGQHILLYHHHMKEFSYDTHDLKDHQIFTVEGVTLEVIYTPGHTADHCTFWLKEEESLFTADCVLGQGTAVFDDLSDYINGLQRLIRLKPKRLYPGHGPIIDHQESAISRIQEYIRHRLERENQILDMFREKAALSPLDIVQTIYKGYPESLHLPAARGIVFHLIKLQRDGKVSTSFDLNELDPENFSNILNQKWVLNKQLKLTSVYK